MKLDSLVPFNLRSIKHFLHLVLHRLHACMVKNERYLKFAWFLNISVFQSKIVSYTLLLYKHEILIHKLMCKLVCVKISGERLDI